MRYTNQSFIIRMSAEFLPDGVWFDIEGTASRRFGDRDSGKRTVIDVIVLRALGELVHGDVHLLLDVARIVYVDRDDATFGLF